MLKKFISYYKPYKRLFALDLLVAFIAASCELFYPMMTRTLINDSIPNKNFKMIIVFAVILIIIYLIRMACTYFMQYWGHVVGVRMQGDMRKDLFEHLQKLPYNYFDNNKTGDIMSRIVNDLMDISELAHHGPEDLFISLVMLVGSFIILCTINIPLTLITFVFVPLIALFTWIKREKMINAFMKTRVKTGEINATLQNSISGIKVSKAFVNDDYELEKFENGNSEFKDAREKAYKVMAEFFAGVGFCTDMLDYVSMIIGAIFIFINKINIGDFLAYILYIKLFMQPIRKLVVFMEQYQSGMTGFKRFTEMLELKEESDEKDSLDINNIEGTIEFDKVSFKYEDKFILNNLSLKIEAGKKFALVGPSGGGKTTFCNLIPRFYDIDNGNIKIDNQDIYKIKLNSLRKNIGIVQQDVFLFTGTVFENILFGNYSATREEVIEAAKKANIHEFIIDLPKGYDTYIGERGVKLSGGQRQRISIARVFLKNPPILILDEATSALDNATEYSIQKSLDSLCSGRTTIIVAHRLSTIKNADEIIVLSENGVKEKGSHQELIKQNGEYTKLYKTQFK